MLICLSGILAALTGAESSPIRFLFVDLIGGGVLGPGIASLLVVEGDEDDAALDLDDGRSTLLGRGEGYISRAEEGLPDERSKEELRECDRVVANDVEMARVTARGILAIRSSFVVLEWSGVESSFVNFLQDIQVFSSAPSKQDAPNHVYQA